MTQREFCGRRIEYRALHQTDGLHFEIVRVDGRELPKPVLIAAFDDGQWGGYPSGFTVSHDCGDGTALDGDVRIDDFIPEPADGPDVHDDPDAQLAAIMSGALASAREEAFRQALVLAVVAAENGLGVRKHSYSEELRMEVWLIARAELDRLE